MRIGVLAYSTATGLGYQVKDYIDHLPVTKIMNVDLGSFNGLPQLNWYPNAYHVKGYPRDDQIEEFLTDIDVMLFAETPLNYNFYSIARAKGIKTVCVPNWEFFDHIVHPEYPLPDVFIMPSVWHYEDAEKFCKTHKVELYQIHHPVDRDKLPFRLRTTNKPLHIAGKPATNDRNGTWDFMQACPEGVVVTQSGDLAYQIRQRYRFCNVFTNVANNAEMYTYGDIMVLPRKYGGNCLPLNEALSSGMPVIMPDISPNNHILPKEWLVPANIVDSFTPRERIDIYQVDIEKLKNIVDWVKASDITKLSKQASDIADTISWRALKDKYIEALS